MTKKLFTLGLMVLVLAATGCTSLHTTGISSELRAGTVAGGVVVVFGNVGTQTSPTYCPIAIVTTDNECDRFRGKGNDRVCRYTDDSGMTINQKRVVWSSATADTAPPPVPPLLFNISFKTEPGPCKNNLGAGDAARKVCNAKLSRDMKFRRSQAVFEYGVTSGSCKPLDPYIVFRR